MRNAKVSVWVGSMALVALAGCAGAVGDEGDSRLLTGGDETTTVGDELSAGVPVGTELETTGDVNMRNGPGTTYAVRQVLAKGTRVTAARSDLNGGFMSVRLNGGTAGWVSASLLKKVADPSAPAPTPPTGGDNQSTETPPPAPTVTLQTPSAAGALLRAQSGKGFSYYWGKGGWLPAGATLSTKGSCTGSCPSCQHRGTWGADCSGYIAKLWQVPSSNTELTVQSHPYSTWDFSKDTAQWKAVSRSSVKLGDSLVYNTSTHGHIFFVKSGDGWGYMDAYEAKGCVYGIVRNTRTAGSAYKAIRRTGY